MSTKNRRWLSHLLVAWMEDTWENVLYDDTVLHLHYLNVCLIDSSSKTLKKSVLDCHVSMLTYIGYLHRLICTRTINYEFLCVCVCFRRTKNNTTLLNEEEFVIFTSQFLWETICFKYNMLLMLLKSLSLWRFMVCKKWLTVKVNIHSQWSLLLYYIVYSCSQFDRFSWYIFNYAVQ